MNYVSYILFFSENVASVNFLVKKNKVAINTDRPVYQKSNET